MSPPPGKPGRIGWVIFPLALLALSISANAGPTTSPFSPWIEQLADPDPHIRDDAEAHLYQIGKPASGALQEALGDPRPEVVVRARRTLRKIRIFLLPGVPDEALGFAQAYLLAPDAEHRKPYLHELFEMQPQPNAVLTRLALLEDDDDLHRQILYQLATGYRDAIARMLVDDDDLPGVLAVTNGAAQMWGSSEAADAAAAVYFSGQIDRRIAIELAELSNGDTIAHDRAATQLCQLYRIAGQSDEALKYARLTHDQQLIFLVLQDQGDWSAAAKEKDDRWRDPVTASAYRAAFQRLAGHSQAAVDIMIGIAATAGEDADNLFAHSRLFLLNDLPGRGIDLLLEQHPAIAFRMHVMRGEIDQALSVAGKYQNHPADHTELTQLLQSLRESLGELPLPSTQPVTVDAEPSGDKAWLAAVTALDDKKYQTAADAFAKMWAADHTHFDRLYLQGFALSRAGNTQEGNKRMQQAQVLPLGDPRARWLFAEQLDAAGLADVAQHQRELALHTGASFDEVGFSEIYNTQAELALEHKQWHAAADALDRLCLINLSTEVQWQDSTRLLTVPALAHLVKAREARGRHDLPETLRELAIYQQYLPMSSDMVLEMVPALDQQGEHAAADQIFAGVFDKLTAILLQYPKSASYQNELAWMSGCCGRRLDEALRAAETAVKLQPENWQVMDTLGEVHFRRGERAAAVAAEKQAMSMSRDEYLARQLKRFESGAIPSTTQPGVAPE